MVEKLIWVTGISEVNSGNYLRKFLSHCKAKRKKVEILYPGEMLFASDVPGVSLDRNNVLNAPDDHLRPKMNWVFDRIAKKLENGLDHCDAVIIKTHRIFKWDNTYRLAHAYDNIMRFNPGLIITFVDGISAVLKRMADSEQFRYQGFGKKDICEWQDLEISLTKEWGETLRKPYFVLPSAESVEVLYELIFNPSVEPSYVAIDITRSLPEVEKRVRDFVERVRRYLPCLINPYTVPLDYIDRTDEEDSHIIKMCLDSLVPQSKNVIGYYPAALPTSEGKTHEIGKALILTKNVWVTHVFPLDKASPFVKRFKTVPIFTTEEDFFRFLEKRQAAREKIEWPEPGD